MTQCPSCGDPMHTANVTCWECYGLSARLTPGVWPDGGGGTWRLTATDVARFDTARTARLDRLNRTETR